MVKKRYLVPYILEDLQEKMVFVGGPRQGGKPHRLLKIRSLWGYLSAIVSGTNG